VITSTIGGLQIFDEPRMFDNFGLGGPDREWMTVTMYLYELGWNTQRNLGRSAAVAWLLFLIIVAFALINFAVTRRIASSDVRPLRKALLK
jgi:cellobiose transport system permease protein